MQVAFYQGRKRLTNRVIADLTGGPFSHVELVLERYPNGWALCVSASMMDGGVRVKLINIGSADWVVITVNVKQNWEWKHQRSLPSLIEEKPVTEHDAWQWFYQHSGAKYDYTGAMRYRLKFLKQHPNKKYCSEAVSEILGMPKSNHPNGLFNDLQRYVA